MRGRSSLPSQPITPRCFLRFPQACGVTAGLLLATGLLHGKRYLLHDRDPLFTAEFLSLLAEAGVASVQLPPRSPNLNARARNGLYGRSRNRVWSG